MRSMIHVGLAASGAVRTQLSVATPPVGIVVDPPHTKISTGAVYAMRTLHQPTPV